MSAFLWESTAEETNPNAFFEHCERSTFSKDMDCQCVADREDELRQWASETHATGNGASQIRQLERMRDAQKERIATETRPERREAWEKGLANIEERLAMISVPLDPSVHQYRTLFTYFDDNLECRSRDKIYASAYEHCESRSRNLGDEMDAFCTCVAQMSADQWSGPEMPEEPVANPMITCRA